jgi:hypothetical protein
MSTDTTTICRDTLATTVYDGPYAALRDRRLAARLAAEDVAEEAGLTRSSGSAVVSTSAGCTNACPHPRTSSPSPGTGGAGPALPRHASPSTSGWGTSGSPARVVAQHRAAARPGSSSARAWRASPPRRTGDRHGSSVR